MSRAMFWKLSYKIMRPDGQFVIQSQNEEMSQDLYENMYNVMDYPLGDETLLVDPKQCSDPTDFLCHLAEVHERWSRQDPLGQFAERLDSVATTDPP